VEEWKTLSDGRKILLKSDYSHLISQPASECLPNFINYLRDDACYSRKCPHCKDSVWFIEHNGGSFWCDELGHPWPIHKCFIDNCDSLTWPKDSTSVFWTIGVVVRRLDIRHDQKLLAIEGAIGYRWCLEIGWTCDLKEGGYCLVAYGMRPPILKRIRAKQGEIESVINWKVPPQRLGFSLDWKELKLNWLLRGSK
jgi:hypothetical protein